ncbi:MAG: ABC transporter permease [Actinomycetes bacterium]
MGTKWWTPYALLSPGFLWLAAFFVLPTILLVQMSLQSGSLEAGFQNTFSWNNYTDALFGKPALGSLATPYWPVFVRSVLFYALPATLLCLVIAYPLAYTIAFRAGRYKNIMLVLVIAPFFTSFLLRTNAWKFILGDTGWVVTIMSKLGLINVLQFLGFVSDGPDRLLASKFAVVMGLTYNFLPFMTLPLYASLERLDGRLVEAAKDLYASAWTAFRKVTWPLSLPGVVAGTLLTFIPAVGDPINPKLLGGPTDLAIGNVIDSKFLIQFDYPEAAALSVMLMAAIVVLVMIYVRRAGTEELV